MTYNHAVFPTKTGMPMPAKSDATDRDYLDFHIVCKGDPFAFWYKIEYTAQPTQLMLGTQATPRSAKQSKLFCARKLRK